LEAFQSLRRKAGNRATKLLRQAKSPRNSPLQANRGEVVNIPIGDKDYAHSIVEVQEFLRDPIKFIHKHLDFFEKQRFRRGNRLNTEIIGCPAGDVLDRASPT
jgi:hypothetical protein